MTARLIEPLTDLYLKSAVAYRYDLMPRADTSIEPMVGARQKAEPDARQQRRIPPRGAHMGEVADPFVTYES